MTYTYARQGLPHPCNIHRIVDDGCGEVAVIAWRHDEVQLASGHIRCHEELVNAPSSRQILRRIPWLHQRQDVADASHPLSELRAKVLEVNFPAACTCLLHPVLVDANCTDPHVGCPGVQPAARAVRGQGVCDDLHRVAPAVAQHVRRSARGAVWDRIDESASSLPIAWTNRVLALRAEDELFDLVHLACACQSHGLQHPRELVAEVIHAWSSQTSAQSSRVSERNI
mmetsp:Transcript_37274/g.93574  ORF Transcript_37274/g.93574 Transcript_37274/m.93574 type:complete len:227 (+) Transcript_37274:1326-2006(+)